MSKRNLDSSISVYLDCTLGIIFSVIAIISIIFTALNKGIFNITFFLIGLIFWIVWLGVSLFLIALGLYTLYLSKHPEKLKSKHKKDIKAPMFS